MVSAISGEDISDKGRIDKAIEGLIKNAPTLQAKTEKLTEAWTLQKKRFKEVSLALARVKQVYKDAGAAVLLNSKEYQELTAKLEVQKVVLASIREAKSKLVIVTDEEAVASKKVAAALKLEADARKKLNREALISLLNQKSKANGDPKSKGVGGGITGISLPTISDEDIQVATEKNAVGFTKFQTEFEKQSEELGTMMEFGLKSIASNAIVSGLAAIGTAIGGGGDSIGSGFAVIGQVLADGMKQLGAAMIAWGIAKIGLDKALESGNGYVALAAGSALVIAGAALGAALHKSQNSSPIGGSQSSGGGGTGRFQFGRESQALSGEFVVRGTDLVLALNNQATQDNRNVAG
jgi:hypothetical protein